MITQCRLKEILSCDPETGIFRWREKIAAKVVVGKIAGWTNDQGYRLMEISGQRFRLHHLAWFYVTGTWPTKEIDHRNGDRADNRFSNLREATCAQNRMNTKLRRDNRSGVKGVKWDRATKKWMARIVIGGRCTYIGVYADIKDAAAAYAKAARAHFGDFARLE